MSKTLHLNLKSKWFDMILSGVKKEEYRDITPYWESRILDKKLSCREWKDFDTITFSNGYAKNRRQFEIELLTGSEGTGNPKWGAKKGQKYFVLELGDIIYKRNII